LCHGSACSAWIEENTIDPEIIDCGWPTIRFLKQSKSIEEAVKELYKLGDRLKAAGVKEQVSGTAEQMMEDHFQQVED
jgi:hypothetical protein